MSITRKRHSQEKDPLLHIVIPKKVVDYASLYSLNKGVSRAAVLRELIVDWYYNQSARVPEDTLMEDISIMLYKVWQSRKRDYRDFEEYLDIVEDELIRRNSAINRKYIAIIMNNLHDFYAKEING